MNYLLFVYFNEPIHDVEFTIKEMAQELKENPLTVSKSVNYIYGGGPNAVFSLNCEMDIDEMSEYVRMIEFGLFPYEYILMPKPENIRSSIPKRRFNAFLSGEPISNEEKKDMEEEPFLFEDVFKDTLEAFNRLIKDRDLLIDEDVNNLTIDNILDKIKVKGLSSLTTTEKNFLDNFSKTI